MKQEIKTVDELNLAIKDCYDSFSDPTFDKVIRELFESYYFIGDVPEVKKFAEVNKFIQSTIDEYKLFKNKQNKQLNFITDNLFKRNLYWMKDKVLQIVEVVAINGFDQTKMFYNLQCKLTIIDFLGKPSNDIKEESLSFSADEFIYFDEESCQYKTYDCIKVI